MIYTEDTIKWVKEFVIKRNSTIENDEVSKKNPVIFSKLVFKVCYILLNWLSIN